MPDYTDSHLWRYLDGLLPPPDAEAIEREARDDERLAARIDELRLIGETVREGAPAPPPGFAKRVAATAQLRGATPRSAEVLDLRRFVRRVLVAAAVLAALGIGYLAVEVVPDIVANQVSAKTDPLMEE
ncbi:MAG: anti-sigma factor [Planctomycetota bacterium]|jgi:anti-sigma factor RsiW